MHLYYQLDAPEARGDVESLLGTISLTHENGIIEEHDVFLDSWFAALIEGLLAAEEGKWGPVEIEEESQPLVFEPLYEGFRISYGSDSVAVPSTAELRKILTQTGIHFFDEADGKVPTRGDDPLDIIYRFLVPPRVRPDW